MSFAPSANEILVEVSLGCFVELRGIGMLRPKGANTQVRTDQRYRYVQKEGIVLSGGGDGNRSGRVCAP